MSRFLTVSDGETKRCTFCQKRTGRTAYFRGRYVCEDCLKLIKEQI